MRILELSCPRCGAILSVAEGRAFGECPSCGQKVIIDGYEGKKAEESFVPDPYFAKVKYIIETDDTDELESELFKMKLKGIKSPHSWLLKAYSELHKHDVTKCTSSWKAAISALDSEYYLTDYYRLFGHTTCSAMAYWSDYEYRMDEFLESWTQVAEAVEARYKEATTGMFYLMYKGYREHNSMRQSYQTKAYGMLSWIMVMEAGSEPNCRTKVSKCNEFMDYLETEGVRSGLDHILRSMSVSFGKRLDGLTDKDVRTIEEFWTDETFEKYILESWGNLLQSEPLPVPCQEKYGSAKPTLLTRLSGGRLGKTYVQKCEGGWRKVTFGEGIPDNVDKAFAEEFNDEGKRDEDTIYVDDAAEEFARIFVDTPLGR